MRGSTISMAKIFRMLLPVRDERYRGAVMHEKMTELLLGDAMSPHPDMNAASHNQKQRKQWVTDDRLAAKPIDAYLVALHGANTAAAEQYRKLYSEIVRAGRVRRLRTLLVTSALAGEGKTLTAVNLALTIAASSNEQRALLVETDFRKPRIQKLLNTQPECGLTDYLLGDAESTQLIHATPIPGLAVVYAGHHINNLARLLNSEKIATFFHQIASQGHYSHIILDSSPLLLTSEPIALIPHVDAALFVVHARKTPREVVNQAIEILGQENIFGCVFNGMTSLDSYYSHHYYSSDYYHPSSHI
jgi:capsular exopolysaccharide synthesis family protein